MSRPPRLAAVMSVLTVCVLPMFLLAALPSRLGGVLGHAGLGVAIAAFWASSGLTSVAAGRLVSSRGPRWGFLLASTGTGAVLVLLLCAASGGGLLFVLAMVAIGFLYSLATCAGNAVLSGSGQGLAFSVKQATVPLAGLVSGVIAATFAGDGWRTCVAVAAALSALVALVSWTLPAETSSRARARRPLGLRNARPLLVISFGACFGTAAANAFGAYLVSGLVADGWSEHSGALVLAAGNLVGIGGRIVAGLLADRIPAGRFVLISLMLAVGACGLALMAAASTAALVVGMLLMYLSGWSWPGVLQYAVISEQATDPAQATGIVQVGPFAGGALGPLVFGQFIGLGGYREAWITASVSAAFAALVIVAGGRVLEAGPGDLTSS